MNKVSISYVGQANSGCFPETILKYTYAVFTCQRNIKESYAYISYISQKVGGFNAVLVYFTTKKAFCLLHDFLPSLM